MTGHRAVLSSMLAVNRALAGNLPVFAHARICFAPFSVRDNPRTAAFLTGAEIFFSITKGLNSLMDLGLLLFASAPANPGASLLSLLRRAFNIAS